MVTQRLILAVALTLISTGGLLAQEKPLTEVEIPKLIDRLVEASDLDLLEKWPDLGGFGRGFMPLHLKSGERRFDLIGPPARGDLGAVPGVAGTVPGSGDCQP